MRSVEEWVGKNDDAAIPPRVKVRVFDRDGKRCRICSTPILGGRWQCDHTVALVNGGENRENNLRCLCLGCHKIKSRDDVAEKSKVARIKMKHLGIRKNSRQTFSSNRKSKLKKKMDGSVVDRATGLPATPNRSY